MAFYPRSTELTFAIMSSEMVKWAEYRYEMSARQSVTKF